MCECTVITFLLVVITTAICLIRFPVSSSDQGWLATPTAANQPPPSTSPLTEDQPNTPASTSATGTVADHSPSCELPLYLWEDWVVLYLRHMRQMLNEKEIPTNER